MDRIAREIGRLEDRGLDEARDIGKTNMSREKPRDGDFVRRAECRRLHTSHPRNVLHQAQAGEADLIDLTEREPPERDKVQRTTREAARIRRAKRQLCQCREIELRPLGGQTFRPRERILDRHAHVGRG